MGAIRQALFSWWGALGLRLGWGIENHEQSRDSERLSCGREHSVKYYLQFHSGGEG